MSILNMLYGSGSGGYAIYDLSLTNDNTNEQVIVKWFEYMPANWVKTVVRYKTGSAPTSPTDGTLAVQETTKNQYSSTGYSVSGLSNNTTYYFSVFAIDSNNTIIDVQSMSITTDFSWHPGEDTILYCPLEDDINDKSGNHTMTLNTTSYGSVVKDSTGFYHFTGGYISSENYTGPTQGTMSVWVKRENKTTGDTSLQWGLTNTYKNGSPFYNMAFEFNSSWYTAVGTGSTTYFRNIGASTLGQWELWTMTYSSSGGGKMYKNGVLVDSFSSNQNLWQYNGPTYIGGNNYTASGRPTPGAQYFKGYLSDVIMEEVARTSSDVLNYFNKTKSNYGL